MSLENDVQRWIEEQRQTLLAKVEQQRRDNTAKAGTFLGLNADGTSRVRVDGVEKNIKITGDVYLRKGDTVMVDEISTGEIKRRRRGPAEEAPKRKRVKKIATRKNQLISEEEEELPGVFFGYSSHLLLGINLRYHALNLYDFYSQFDNIGVVHNHSLYRGNGIQHYLSSIGISLETTGLYHDGTLFYGGFYDSILGRYTKTGIKISDYKVEDIVEEIVKIVEANYPYTYSGNYYYMAQRLLAEFSENDGEEFLVFLGDIQISSFTGTVADWHNSATDGNDLFEGLEVDPIGEGLNVIYATNLDWAWYIQGWPHTPNRFYFDPEEICVPPLCPSGTTRCEVVFFRDSIGTDESFPDDFVTVGATFEKDYYIASYTSNPEIKDCLPSNPESYPCEPCYCGSGFFGCDYYTWAYRQCDGSWGCSPITGSVIRGTGALSQLSRGAKRILRPFAYTSGYNHSGTYPVVGFSEANYLNEDEYYGSYEYPTKKILTMRPSILQALNRAQDAGYYVLLNFDYEYFVSFVAEDYLYSSTGLMQKAPLTGDQNGLLLDEHTVISFLENLNREAFVYKTPEYRSEIEYVLDRIQETRPIFNQLNQELNAMNDSYDNVFEKIYNQYGPVSEADFDQIRVFNCTISKSFDLHERPYSGSGAFYEERIRIDLERSGPRRAGPLSFGKSVSANSTVTEYLLTCIEEARDWFFTSGTAQGIVDKPINSNDKYYYVLFALMCGLFTKDQLLTKNPAGGFKYVFQ